MGSYSRRFLESGEEIVADGRLHWFIYRWAILLVIVGFVLFVYSLAAPDQGGAPAFLMAGILMLAGGIGIGIEKYLKWLSTELVVTNYRVILKTGLLSRSTSEINMQRVESVLIEQGIFGRIFNYGTVIVRGTGQGLDAIAHLRDPMSLRSAIMINQR